MKNNSQLIRPFKLSVWRLQNILPTVASQLEIFFILEGNGYFTFAREKVKIKPGMAFFLSPGTEYYYSGDSSILVHFSLNSKVLLGVFSDIDLHPFTSFSASMGHEDSQINSSGIQEFLHFVVHYYQEEQGTKVYQSFFSFLSIFEHMIENNRANLVFSPQKGGDVRISQMVKIIHESYETDLNLNDLAESLHVSYTYLSKLFKKETGYSFLKYLNNIRLNGVEQDLRSTNDSIYAVAINNGFSNLKTMSQLFKTRHHQTPSEYRQTLKLTNERQEQAQEMVNGNEVIENLSKFITVSGQGNYPEQVKSEELFVSTNQGQKKAFHQPYRIAKIAHAEDGLLKETQEQLVILKEELNFTYVQFEGFCELTTYGNTLYFMDSNHKNNQLFDFLYENQLAPFIQLGEFSYRKKDSPEDWLDEVAKIISSLMSRYEISYFSSWKIGWFPQYTKEDTAIFLKLYQRVKAVCPRIQFGFLSLSYLDSHESLQFEKFAKALSENGIIPEFLSMMADPYSKKIPELQRVNVATHYMEYQEKMIQAINQSLKKISLEKEYEKTELLLTDWNTLAGEGETYTGSFFRSALIAHAMIKMSTQLHGVTFWLNAKVSLLNAERREDSSLSIFLYNRIKRPVFFVLSFLDKMEGFVIKEDVGYLLTKKGSNLFLLLYNPSFLNPRASVDRFSVDETAKKINVLLGNISKGDYILKRYLLDKDHGGVYNQLLQISSLKDASKEWENQLEQKIIPLFTTEHIVLQSEELSFSSHLSFNALELIQLRKM